MMMPDDVTAGQAVSQNCGSAHQECLQTCYVQAVLGVYRATLSLNMVRHGKHRMDKTSMWVSCSRASPTSDGKSCWLMT